MISFDTLPLDVDFGHLLTGSNFSDDPGEAEAMATTSGERNVMSGIP